MNRLLSIAFAAFAATATPGAAHDYLAAAAHPDQVVIVDAEAMKVVKSLKVEGAGATPIVPVVSPDRRFVYVLTNGSQSVVKINMETGENVARIDMSNDEERNRAGWAMDLSPDGKTIAVYQNPVRLLTTEYQVQPTRIAFYDAETMELRQTIPAPRQIMMLFYSPNGAKLYAVGRHLFIFDGRTGEQITQEPIQEALLDTHSPVDLLNVWYQFDNSDMFIAPYYGMLKDKEPSDPTAFVTGLYTLDTRSGESRMQDVEPTSALYFSMSVSPDRKRSYAVYNVLQSFDMENGGKPLKQVPLDHTSYAVLVSSDNKTVWVAGGAGDVTAYDAETLEKRGRVELPQGGAMSNNTVRFFTMDK